MKTRRLRERTLDAMQQLHHAACMCPIEAVRVNTDANSRCYAAYYILIVVPYINTNTFDDSYLLLAGYRGDAVQAAGYDVADEETGLLHGRPLPRTIHGYPMHKILQRAPMTLDKYEHLPASELVRLVNRFVKYRDAGRKCLCHCAQDSH